MNASANRLWVMLLKGKEELIAIYYGYDWNLLPIRTLLEKVDMTKTSENLSFLKMLFFFFLI